MNCKLWVHVKLSKIFSVPQTDRHKLQWNAVILYLTIPQMIYVFPFAVCSYLWSISGFDYCYGAHIQHATTYICNMHSIYLRTMWTQHRWILIPILQRKYTLCTGTNNIQPSSSVLFLVRIWYIKRLLCSCVCLYICVCMCLEKKINGLEFVDEMSAPRKLR